MLLVVLNIHQVDNLILLHLPTPPKMFPEQLFLDIYLTPIYGVKKFHTRTTDG